MLSRGRHILGNMFKTFREHRQEENGSENRAESFGDTMMAMRTIMPTAATRSAQDSANAIMPGMSHNAQVYHLFLFNNPDLLRASRLTDVMSRQGSILGVSEGSAETYDLSEPVESIDAFLSHNWAMPRGRKFACLAIHYYFKTAAVVTGLMMMTLLGLTRIGWLPDSMPQAVLFLYIPFFVLAISCMQDINKVLGFLGPTIFLDKTCIHQENRQIQRQGIKKLGAFLNVSETMVVIYSGVYLHKLWTIYEMASWTFIKPLKDMKIVPHFIPIVVAVCLIVPWVVNLAIFFMDPFPLTQEFLRQSQMTRQMITAQVMLYPCRKFARRQAKIYSNMAQFDVGLSECYMENDRPLVYRNISDILKTIQAVPEEATMEECLATFNDMVRKNLPDAVRDSLGNHLGLTYVHTLAFVLLPELRLFEMPRGAEPADLAKFISQTTNTFIVMPLLFAIVIRNCNSQLNLGGVLEVVYLQVCIFLWFGAIYVMDDFCTWEYAPQPTFTIAYFVIMGFVCLAVFNPSARCPRDTFNASTLQPPVQLGDLRPSLARSSSVGANLRQKLGSVFGISPRPSMSIPASGLSIPASGHSGFPGFSPDPMSSRRSLVSDGPLSFNRFPSRHSATLKRGSTRFREQEMELAECGDRPSFGSLPSWPEEAEDACKSLARLGSASATATSDERREVRFADAVVISGSSLATTAVTAVSGVPNRDSSTFLT